MQLIEPQEMIQTQLRIHTRAAGGIAKLKLALNISRRREVFGRAVVDVREERVNVEEGEGGARVTLGEDNFEGRAVSKKGISEFGVFLHSGGDQVDDRGLW